MTDLPHHEPVPVIRIVSGGQTGVDQGALRAARELGIEHGGWCPRGRRSEAGTIPVEFDLRETPTWNYAERTRWNVRDSDGTLVLYRRVLQGGTALTVQFAEQSGKPCHAVDIAATPVDLRAVRDWLRDHRIRVLNVAGPRESSCPGIGAWVESLIRELLRGTAPTWRPPKA